MGRRVRFESLLCELNLSFTRFIKLFLVSATWLVELVKFEFIKFDRINLTAHPVFGGLRRKDAGKFKRQI